MSCDGNFSTVTASIDDTITEPPGSNPLNIHHVASGSYTPKFAGISYDFNSNQYLLSVDDFQPSGQVLYDGAVEQSGINWGVACAQLALQQTKTAFPATGLILTGGPTFQGAPCGFELPGVLDQTAGTTQVSFTLTPVTDLDLVITIPNYDTWRPSAGRTEKEDGVGDPLILQANLIRKSTGINNPVGPDKITFHLAQVSHETGVALNWPVTGATNDPDMLFTNQYCVGKQCSPINAGFNITDPATAEYDQPFSFILVQLNPRDWGGTATLNVDAVLDGITYHGHLQGDTNSDILLPKRQPGSMIADGWKTANGIALDTPDSDDSEKGAVAAAKLGDGFTLYEEYRGFYMGCSRGTSEPAPEGTAGARCQRVEGDPNKKDLFIAEKTTADPGILQFASDSGVNVHFKGLQVVEFGPQGTNYRVMNLNHTDGAHEVDQHALIIQLGSSSGASRGINIPSIHCAGTSHSCRPGVPAEIDHIEMAYKKADGLDGSNERWVSDVAHEISHAANLYHHGDIDADVFWSIDPTTGGVVEQKIVGNLPAEFSSPSRSSPRPLLALAFPWCSPLSV